MRNSFNSGTPRSRSRHGPRGRRCRLAWPLDGSSHTSPSTAFRIAARVPSTRPDRGTSGRSRRPRRGPGDRSRRSRAGCGRAPRGSTCASSPAIGCSGSSRPSDVVQLLQFVRDDSLRLAFLLVRPAVISCCSTSNELVTILVALHADVRSTECRRADRVRPPSDRTGSRSQVLPRAADASSRSAAPAHSPADCPAAASRLMPDASTIRPKNSPISRIDSDDRALHRSVSLHH